MADKWQDLAGRLKNAGGGGAPRGLGIGIKLLAGGIAAAYGLQQSMYTGQATYNNTIFQAHCDILELLGKLITS